MRQPGRLKRNVVLFLATSVGPIIAMVVAAAQAPTRSLAPLAADFFEAKMRPVLEKHCLGCHGVGATLGGLDLRTRTAALKGGTRGPALVSGNADKSVLMRLVSYQHAPNMPPNGKLPLATIQLFRSWIDGGAPYSKTALATAKEQIWWSFKAPVRPRLPSLAANPVDAFLLQKQIQSKFKPNPPAPKRTLIRRAYLDLWGLPPSPEEVAAFEADNSPRAYERLIDRLLASPHYGERWGRHWLDLVRYADSGGFEGDRDRHLMFKYRDYVIASFNADKPYTQFVQEQLAGEELKQPTNESIVATGYLASGPQDIVEMNERTRSNEIDDLVSTTTSVFLGLTVGCARCHDHKYDPVTQTDYYRLAAIFAPTERRDIDIPTEEELKAKRERDVVVDAEAAPVRRLLEPLRQKGIDICKKGGNATPTDEQIAAALPESERKQFQDESKRLQTIEAKRIQLPKAYAVTDKGRTFGPSHFLVRGDAYNKGPVVQPGFVCSLPGGKAEVTETSATEKTTGRRKALADWIASPENPLTARVFVNRVWRQHFGRGLVNSAGNFGISGELPTHPELLDWLAIRFVEGGWKLKPIHKLIMLSKSYQQGSAINKTFALRDPQNKLYWRYPVRRLEAEAVRDSVLSVSGAINLQMGGPPVYPPVDPSLRADTFQGPNWQDGKDDSSTWRRSVYVKVKRSLPLPELDVFDCPEVTQSVGERNITTTPLQALTLLNAPFLLRQSELFADRLTKECGKDPRKLVDRAYQLALSRPPTAREMALCVEFLRTRELREFCQSILNLNEFVYVP